MKVINVVGARPNFMKIAPIIRELKKYPEFESLLVHTGQHYDKEMSKYFFNDLGLPKPNIYLGIGSGTHSEQTAKIMLEFGKVCLEEKPDLVMVVGDVNSTIACALVAAKLNIPAAHIEAGLRSFDRTMPEEINRILTDQISDYLFTHCREANKNLRNEGISDNKIFFVGNVMIDTLLTHLEIAKKSNILRKMNLGSRNYITITLHRPSNVDDLKFFNGIMEAIETISKKIKIIFPAHPRTTKQLEKLNIQKNENLLIIPPVGYFDFLCLMSNAALVLTDSGGIQEETTILGVPCLTLRHNTERSITVEQGTNKVIGNNSKKIIKSALTILKSPNYIPKTPELWDGKAAERIVKILLDKINYFELRN